jgi:hypothetical protein
LEVGSSWAPALHVGKVLVERIRRSPIQDLIKRKGNAFIAKQDQVFQKKYSSDIEVQVSVSLGLKIPYELLGG